MFLSRLFVILSLALIAALPAAADVKGYGVVKSFGEGKIVVVLADSVGTWTVDAKTEVKGPIAPSDWVYVAVETSGHVKILRLEETPASRAGVVVAVRSKNVLVVRSGNKEETWNVTPETILGGIERGEFQPGDAIGAKLYKNHNLAELTLNKRGVKIN